MFQRLRVVALPGMDKPDVVQRAANPILVPQSFTQRQALLVMLQRLRVGASVVMDNPDVAQRISHPSLVADLFSNILRKAIPGERLRIIALGAQTAALSGQLSN